MVIAGRQSYYLVLHFFRGQLVGVSRAQEIREQQFYYLVHTGCVQYTYFEKYFIYIIIHVYYVTFIYIVQTCI